MSGLRRNAPPLLRKVKNKPHATQNDHHDVLPTPPATNSTRSLDSQSKIFEEAEDIYRDPVSSEDESVPPAPAFVQRSVVDGAHDADPAAAAHFKSLQTRGYGRSPEKPKRTFERPSRPNLRSPESTRSKRSNESDEQSSSDHDGMILSSQSSAKKPKTTNTNIHTVNRKSKFQYGKKAQRSQSSSQKAFTKPTKAEKKALDEPAQPRFHRSTVPDIFQFKGEQDATFTTAGDTADPGARNSLSPSLSSLSSVPDSPGVEEVATFDLPTGLVPYCPTVNCDICGRQVDKLKKENFQDQFTGGKALNFKWQQRFCQHHQRETAREYAKEKGYPDVDWAGLETRMRKFDNYLRDVICNRVKSQWKHDLKRHMQPSKSKFPEVRAAANAQEVKSTAWTGYYGPRGERVMTDHIVANLSDDLRERASKDNIVAAAGVKGGMSGFVHGVLVPELTCQLIAEDLGIDADECRVTVGQSDDVGKLLNPDLDDDVTGRRGRAGRDEDEMEE